MLLIIEHDIQNTLSDNTIENHTAYTLLSGYQMLIDVDVLKLMKKYKIPPTKNTLDMCFSHDNLKSLKWLLLNTNCGWPLEDLPGIQSNRYSNGKCVRFMAKIHKVLFNQATQNVMASMILDPYSLVKKSSNLVLISVRDLIASYIYNEPIARSIGDSITILNSDDLNF
jgi:hypothetical protein